MKKFLILIIVFIPLGIFSQTWEDLDNEGYSYYKEGKYKLALDSYEKALNLAKTQFGEKSEKYATSLYSIGTVFMEAGVYETAQTYFIKSLKLRETLLGKESNEYADNLNNLGTTELYMGDYLTAEKDLLASAAIRKKMQGETSASYASSLNNLAYLYQMMNRFDDSEKAYQASLVIYEERSGKKSASYAQGLNNLGYLYQETGLLSESEKFYLEALEIRKDVLGTSHQDYGMSLSNLGVLYCNLGLYEKSIIYLEEAKGIVEKVLGNTHPDYAMIINNLAYSYSAISNYNQAEVYYKESIEINRSTIGEKNPYFALGLGNLAQLYSDTKRYTDAIGLYKQTISILEATVGPSNPRYAESLMNLAVVYHKSGKFAQADSNYKEALAIYESVFDANNMGIASLKNNMAALYWSMGNDGEAKKYFIDAQHIFSYQINVQSAFLSESEMSKFLYDNIHYIRSFYSFCNSYYKTDPSIIGEMNQYYSLVNGKLLKNANQLKQEMASTKDTAMISKYEKWQSLKISINKEMSLPAKYRNQFVADWEDQSIKLEKDLTRLSGTFKSGIESPGFDWRMARSQLNDDEAIVEFVSFHLYNGKSWTDSMLYSAMIIRPQDSTPIYIPLFEEDRLAGLFAGDTLRTFANLLYTNAQVRSVEDHDISYGDSLYKLIWKPMDLYLKNVKHIYYIPSALLHNVAHEAIPIDDSKLLSDKYLLSRITSTSNISKTNNNNFQMNSIAMFGGIQYELDLNAAKASNKQVDHIFYASRSMSQDTLSRGGSWTYLPGAKKEVESIADLLRKNKVKVSMFTDEDGKEETVKSFNNEKSPSVFHFSTHGFFFPDADMEQPKQDQGNAFTTADNPLFRSGLIFSGGNYVWKGNQPINGIEDGILTSYEVSNLYLPNTRLVVLSACETGLGDIKRSEGVYGLQRAFKMAGVDYIIVTLWQVLDKETSDFMILFYENLIEKKSVPLAFKATQDTIKNKYKDEPYKWAGFVLIN